MALGVRERLLGWGAGGGGGYAAMGGLRSGMRLIALMVAATLVACGANADDSPQRSSDEVLEVRVLVVREGQTERRISIGHQRDADGYFPVSMIFETGGEGAPTADCGAIPSDDAYGRLTALSVSCNAVFPRSDRTGEMLLSTTFSLQCGTDRRAAERRPETGLVNGRIIWVECD